MSQPSRLTFTLALALAAAPAGAEDSFSPYAADAVPQTVEALWADIDPRAEPLDIEVVEEWRDGGVTTRYLLYTVCTHGGEPCRVAAFYCFPTGAKGAPAFVWAHGGGQRAERRRGEYFARRGYATLDYNWGGREMVEGIAANTDWGKLDPSQGPRFYPGALRPNVKLNLEPDGHTVDSVASPRNGNWFLLALAGRRGITLLERQAEVDPGRIGFTGYSMGGNITAYCAIDPRLKAVAPMVGGTGHLTRDFPGLPGTSRARQYRHPALFAATMDAASYWPLVACPVLFLNATNDFHGIFDWSFACADLLPHDRWHASYNLHWNHSLRSEQYAALNLFFDHHLKGVGGGLPATARARLELAADGSRARFDVRPDPARAAELVAVEVLYSHDPNPRARHWRTAKAGAPAAAVAADLPVRPKLPLLAFANLTYRMPEPEVAFEDGPRPAEVYTVTSNLAAHMPAEIDAGTLDADAAHRPVFHDFVADGDRGWGSSSGRRGLRTYRFRDPERAAPPPGAVLTLRLREARRSPLVVRMRLTRDEWLTPGVGKTVFAASKSLAAGASAIRFGLGDFRAQGAPEGAPPPDWERVSSFEFELLEPEQHHRPIDLTRPENRGFLRDLVWEPATRSRPRRP